VAIPSSHHNFCHKLHTTIAIVINDTSLTQVSSLKNMFVRVRPEGNYQSGNKTSEARLEGGFENRSLEEM